MHFNVFLNLRRDDLCCLVPSDRAVPSFIGAEEWCHAGMLDSRVPYPELRYDLADAGCQLNGFYLFLVRRKPAFRDALHRSRGLATAMVPLRCVVGA